MKVARQLPLAAGCLLLLCNVTMAQDVTYESASGTTGANGSATADWPNSVKPGETITVTSVKPGTSILITPRVVGGSPIGDPFFAAATGAPFTVPTSPSLLGITFELDPDQLLPTLNTMAGQ